MNPGNIPIGFFRNAKTFEHQVPECDSGRFFRLGLKEGIPLKFAANP